jgi:MscS family membrane protein
MSRFLAATRAGQYARAAEFLDLRQLPRSERPRRGPELAQWLETVLDRALWVDPEQLSDQPEGDPADGLPPLRDSLGTVETRDGPVEIVLERVWLPNGALAWKVAASTVAAIPALYEEYGWGPLAAVLPKPFFEIRVLGVRLWQWIALVLLLGGSWLASQALDLVVGWLVRRRGLVARIPDYAHGPLRLGLGVAVFMTGLPLLALPLPVRRFLFGGATALGIVAGAWFLLRGLDALSAGVERRLPAHRRARAIATVPLGRRAVKVFIAIVAVIAALQNFGYNVTGLIAGLGVGGLAVALAAQKTVENFFGGVSLVADQPVRVGDVCRFGDTVGTIEDIGLRSTRVRTVDRTVITIPNAQFSTLALENLSERDRIPLRGTVTLPPDTSAERVRAALAALRTELREEPKVDPATARARFVRMGPQALEIEIFAYVLTTTWDEFVDVRERVFLAALHAVGGVAAAVGPR